MSGLNFVEFTDVQWILLASVICTAVYQYIVRPWGHFQRHGIAFDRGVPPFGTNWRRLFKGESLQDTLRRVYYTFPNERFVGMYEIGGGASYIVRDPELVKDITTKHFDHFVDRILLFDESTDPLYAHALTGTRGDAWRRMRSLLTPLFTGSKYRTIVMPSMIASKELLIQHLMAKASEGVIEVDMMDLATRMAIESFCRSSMGIETDVLENNNNDFKLSADETLNHMDGMSYATAWAVGKFPRLMKYTFGLTMLSQKAAQFCTQVMSDVADLRERNRVERMDVLGLLVNVRKPPEADDKNVERLSNFTETDMIAQCLDFFEATFTENNLIINYIAHALVEHPDIQQQLYEEMLRIKKNLNGAVLLNETLRDMKYMDMVLSEALRLCLITPNLLRRATKPYTLDNGKGGQIQVRVGEAVWIPSFIMQNDAQYFPDPEVFDPERFSEENKGNIVNGTYAPYGLGPRDCIGCRYITMEVKVTFYYMLQNFKLLKAPSADGKHLLLRQRVE